MKKTIIITLGFWVVLSCVPVPANAQSGFFAGIDAASSNFWTGTGIQIIENLANIWIEDEYDGDEITPALGGRYTYDVMKFTDDGKRLKINDEDLSWAKSLYGFRAKDLFGHIIANAKIGWMGEYSPIGAYLHFGYDYRYFSLALSYQTEAQDYRIGTLIPGIGIRISPGNFYDSDADNFFILEFGTNYNARVSYKGAYGNDKSQLNNGLSYVASVGISNEYVSVLLGVEWTKQDLFNKSYTPDNGLFYPYCNLSSRLTSIFLSINYGF